MQKKGVAPSVVIILSLFLIVISVVSIITVNNQINSKMLDLNSKSAKTNDRGQIAVVLEPTPSLGAEVSVNIEEKESSP